MNKMKKLSLALVCSLGLLGGAIAAPSATLNTPVTVSGEGTPPEFTRHWDKKQWNGMNSTQRAEYKKNHHHWWNKMTPAEKEAYKAQHKGQRNYMDKNWNKPVHPQN